MISLISYDTKNEGACFVSIGFRLCIELLPNIKKEMQKPVPASPKVNVISGP